MFYSLHRFSLSSQQFINSFIGNNRSRSDGFSFAIAAALVKDLKLCPELDESFFKVKYKIELLEALGKLNEVLRFDVDKILFYAEKLFNHRMSQVYLCSRLNVINSSATAVVDFFGLTRYFSLEDFKLIEECGEQINIDVVALCQMFEEIGLFSE